jgi:hypothetical protein
VRPGIRVPDTSAEQLKSPLVGTISTSDNLYQCRLARAVLADKAMDLAGEKIQINGVQCNDPGKKLANAA